MILRETKLDSMFPDNEFFVEGFRKSYRMETQRNRDGNLLFGGYFGQN